VFTECTHSNLIGLFIINASTHWRSFTFGVLQEFEYDVVLCELFYHISQISQQVYNICNTYHTRHVDVPYLDTILVFKNPFFSVPKFNN